MNSDQRFDKLIMVGDRLLIKPVHPSLKTQRGLYLPASIQEREEVQSGYVMKAGPGYPLPVPEDRSDEVWKNRERQNQYMPLQARVGDLAIFLRKGAVEVDYGGEKYVIISQGVVLMLERDEEFVQ